MVEKKVIKGYVEPEIYSDLKILSKELDISISSLIARCILQGFECYKSELKGEKTKNLFEEFLKKEHKT